MNSSNKGMPMQINPALQNAAVAVVNKRAVGIAIQIPGFPGMFVAKKPDTTIDTMHAFIDNGTEYIIGPTKK